MSDLAGMNILIVEDTPANIDVLRGILSNMNLEISIAMNGEMALKLVETAQPDLIMMDVMMPGIDGFEACQRLKANPSFKDIPVIFVTARTGLEDIVRGFEVGGVDYITKPFQREEVLSRVSTHLKIGSLIKDKIDLNQKLQDQNEGLVESQNQYRIILDKSSDGVFRLDPDGNIMSSNARFHFALGYDAKELISRPIMDIVNVVDSLGTKQIIATRRFGERATQSLQIQFCVNEKSPIWKDRKYHSFMLDSYGIWNLPNNKIFEKGVEKKYMGAICIVSNST